MSEGRYRFDPVEAVAACSIFSQWEKMLEGQMRGPTRSKASASWPFRKTAISTFLQSDIDYAIHL